METTASNASRICRLVDWMPPRWLLLVLLCGVLVLRQNYLLAHLDALADDPDGYRAVAWSLHHEHTFGVRATNRLQPRPIATRPPLYPLVLSLGYLFDDDLTTPAAFFHVVLGTLTVYGVWRLGRMWKLPPGACLVAAAMVAIDPILLAHSAQLMTETLITFLAAVTLIALTKFAQQDSIAWALVAGLSAGLCVLCRPEFLLWLALVATVFPFAAEGPRRTGRVAAYLAVAAAVLMPWGIRNFRVFSWPVITTTHGGFTLLLANNPDFYQYLRSAPWGSAWDGKSIYRKWEGAQQQMPLGHPHFGARDEVANDRWAYSQAFDNIRAEPGIFAYSCLVRVGRLWNVLPHQTSPDESPSRRGMRWAVAIWYVFEFALAAAGAWFLRAKLFAAPWVWGTLLLLSITAVHACYWTDLRMRAPLVTVVALAAAYGLTLLACGKPAASSSGQAA